MCSFQESLLLRLRSLSTFFLAFVLLHSAATAQTFPGSGVTNNGSIPNSSAGSLTPKPVNLGPDMVICPGMQVTLDAGYPYSSYQWNDGSVGQTFTTTSTGSYIVSVTDIAGNISTDTLTVLAQPAVIAAFAIAGGGPAFTFINTSSNAVVYVWDFGDGNSSLNPNPVHNYSTNGNYSICLEAISDCESKTTCQSISFKKGWNSGEQEHIEISIRGAGNGDGSVFVTMTGGASIQRIKLLDIYGGLVQDFPETAQSADNSSVQTGSLENGIYLVEAETDAGSFARKIYVSR